MAHGTGFLCESSGTSGWGRWDYPGAQAVSWDPPSGWTFSALHLLHSLMGAEPVVAGPAFFVEIDAFAADADFLRRHRLRVPHPDQ